MSTKQLLSTVLSVVFYAASAQTTTINYTESTSDFANPERGFYRYSETRASSYSLLNQATLEGFRQLHSPHSGTPTYQIYTTLVFRYFFLDDFKTSSISTTFLNNMQTDFNTARAAGVKLIPRFAYTDDVNDSGCASWICPPYGDASKAWVETHISQLTPVLQANEDVIAVVQMGLIGVWGENYYTDYFGDASLSPFKLLDKNWNDRIDVLEALLTAVPSNRMVQVRYPQMKQRTIYGVSAGTNSTALTLGEAYNGSNKARIGFHNDCLLASWTDFGTYNDYGNTATSSTGDTTNLKPYFANDSKFVAVGGETCSSYDPFDNCESTNANARADEEFRRLHYSYLNAEYNFPAVNSDWMGICMEDIQKELGYRLVLMNGTFSNEAQPGQVISFELNLQNKGYAAPFNPRAVEIILRNTSTNDKWYASMTNDPRHWFRELGAINLSVDFCIPVGIPTDNYELLLNLADPQSSLYADPDYSIRLANQLPNTNDVWESATGYNNLGHTLIINNTATNSTCTNQTSFSTNNILPIELIEFKATALENSIQLNWTTARETNNQGFNLQRSINANDFENIGWLQGQGNSNTAASYEYEDITAIVDQTYYYRLEQIDFDETKTHSHLVSGFLENANAVDENNFTEKISIFPNPADDFLKIEFSAKIAYQTDLIIFNILGEEIDRKTIPAFSNLTYNCQHLPKGIYHFQFGINGKVGVKKVVID